MDDLSAALSDGPLRHARLRRVPTASGSVSHSRDLVGLIESLELAPTALVGVSLGGAVALDVTVARPELVSALVLVGSGLRGHEFSAETQAGWAEEEEAFERGDLDAAVETNLRMWVDGPRRSPEDVDPDLRRRVGEMQRRAFELDQSVEGEPTFEVLAPDHAERLGEIAVPTLILVGELDRPEMHEIADKLEAGIPNTRRATLDATAHVPSMERPQRVRRARAGLPRGDRAVMSSLEAVELVDRIWARDPTVWTGRDEAHWLGWLDEPGRMLERLEELEGLDRDFDDVVLLGMGGSSLGPEVIRRTFGITRLHVLDTTHPTAIRRLEQEVDLDRTLFVGASKSGTTLETRSQLDYFLAARPGHVRRDHRSRHRARAVRTRA